MTAIILATAGLTTRITVRQRMGMVTMIEGMVGMALPEGIVHVVGMEAFPSPVPRLRALERPLLVQAHLLLAQARLPSRQKGDTALRENRR